MCALRFTRRTVSIGTGLSLLALVSHFAPSARGQSAAAPGSLDATFAPSIAGMGYAIIYATAVQADGKVIAGGEFTTVNGAAKENLCRLTVDGQTDASFAATATADAPVRALLIQPDGKIVAGGEFTRLSGAGWNRIGRLEANGNPDLSFNPGTGPNGRVHALDLSSSGKLFIGGEFSRVDGVTRGGIARLNASGSLDTSFVANTDGTVYAIKVLSDDRVLIGGDFSKVNGASAPWLARLNADGSLDTTFTGKPDFYVYAIAPSTNSDFYIGGTFSRVNGSAHSGVARLKASGAVDETFSANSSGTVYRLLAQPDNKVIVAGRFTTLNNIARANIARVQPNGAVDTTFDPASGPDYLVRSLSFQGSELIIGGEFRTVNFVDQPWLARLNGDPAPKNPGLEAMIWTAVEVGWKSENNASYQVEWSARAKDGVWLPLGEPVTGNGGTNSVFDTTRTDYKRFYRVRKLN